MGYDWSIRWLYRQFAMKSTNPLYWSNGFVLICSLLFLFVLLCVPLYIYLSFWFTTVQRYLWCCPSSRHCKLVCDKIAQFFSHILRLFFPVVWKKFLGSRVEFLQPVETIVAVWGVWVFVLIGLFEKELPQLLFKLQLHLFLGCKFITGVTKFSNSVANF